ncbi:GHKL domain-containing protein, partial [Enterococcus sp. 6D12_DIV0197]|uniref:GHKL domain-containing protein n=1 Tax=Enterococcus sp. 6D12_DIV0197 TaxID=1834184 RepID=UPI0014825065
VNTEINCFCPEKFDISNDFIIAVIGNLFDNAIDACKLLPINIPKHIKVKIKYYNRSLFIDIKNTVPENFEINDLIEGTGIKSMKKMIEENNGIYRRFSHGKEFCVQIVIWF